MTTTMEISSNTPSFGTKTDRAEIDTNVPFESVKEAVTLFGEMGAAERARKKSSDFPSERSAFERTRKKSSDFSPERGVVERNRGKSSDFSPEKLQESKETLMQFVQMETQLHLLQKDERKLKEKLKRGEETKKQGILQLEQLKKTADGLSSKLKLIEDSTEKARKASEIASLRVDELQETNMGSPKTDDRGLQSELANARNEQVSTANELETTKQELLKLKQEVHASEESKANAVRQAQEAKTKAEKNSERAKELEKEIDLAQKSHAYLKSATKELEKQKMEAISEKEEEVQKTKVIIEQIRKQIAEVSQEISLTEEIEKQLSITKEEIKKTQNELDIMKQKYHKDLGDSAHPIDKLRELTVEIEKAKKQESDTLLLIKAKTSEIETKNENLKKVNEETLAAKASFDHLKEESEKIKKEISELNEIDLTEEGRAAELNSELHKARAKLTVAIAAEQKAKDSVSDFTQTIQQLTAEAEDAIKEANTLNDEANKAKLEIKKKNEDLRSLNDRLQVACKELEEVKTTEVLAKEKIKLLIEKTSAERASISNSADGLVISQSEFDSLSTKVEETEGLTEKKVAALMAQVDAIKAGEQELLMKLEAATREIEHLKSTEAAELENAKRAEAAKMALEGELIRRRQREQEKPVHRRPTSDLMSSEKSSDRSSFVESREANTQLIIQALTANNKNVKEGTEKQYQTRPSSDSQPSRGPLEAAVKKEQQDKTMTSTISMKKKMAFPNIGRFLSFGKKKRVEAYAT